MSMHITAQCNFMNAEQAGMETHLKVGQFLAMTYGGNLRLGLSGEDPFLTLREVPKKALVMPEMPGHKLYLNLWHGRKNRDDEMDEWGFNATDVEGHVAPRGDWFLFADEGVRIITFDQKAEKGWTEQLIPFDGDMIHFGGNYYGDWSADNDGKV